MCLKDMYDLAWGRYTDLRKADIKFSLTQMRDLTWNMYLFMKGTKADK